MFKLFDTVALARDIPAESLMRGDLGAIVEMYNDEAFEVEFVAASGKTQVLVTLEAQDVRALDDSDMLSVRSRNQSGGA